MAKYRNHLPQLGEQIFLTDGGLETTLIFHDGLALPYFAAFDLLRTPQGRQTLHDYYARYAAIARQRGVGFIFESATWRASADWAARLGLSDEELATLNRAAIDMLKPLRAAFETERSPMVICSVPPPSWSAFMPSALREARHSGWRRPMA